MHPAPPAIHYRVTVMCEPSPCTLPILVEPYGGGGSPTPVPLRFPAITLRVDPSPQAVPPVTWRSKDESIVVVTPTSPLETVLRMPGDTAATPPLNSLRMLLAPGPIQNGKYVGDSLGVTRVEADIGAPVNERVSIPVYTTGSRRSAAPRFSQGIDLRITPLPQTREPAGFHTAIDYADPLSSTYGRTKALFTEVPWPRGTGGFVQTYASVRVNVSPLPYNSPNIDWSIDGDSANVQRSGAFANAPLIVQGVHPGRSMLHAKIGAPVSDVVSIPLITYATLVLPCRSGVRFGLSGEPEFTTDASRSDLYSDCTALHVPGGGIMLTNGNDPARRPAKGAARGPQFPELDASAWSNAFTTLDWRRYGEAIEPCTVPESPGVVRIDYSCTAMPAHTLLFRTRDGRYVKWLIQIGNGMNLLAGPYQVL